MEDISTEGWDEIWKSGAIVSLLKYCYCTAMQWSSEDNECTHAEKHTCTHTHRNPTKFTQLSSFVLDLRSKGERSPNLEVIDPPHLCVHLLSSSVHLGQLPGRLPKWKWAAGHQSAATQ